MRNAPCAPAWGCSTLWTSFNTRLERAQNLRLAIRVGIHTGLVVVGEMGGGGHHEQLALGETPNVAARIQAVAEPNTVALSAATYDLIQGYFVCQERGLQALKGVAAPLRVYRVLRESSTQHRLDIATTRGLTPLVGRESEVTFLRERWEHVTEGQGHVVLVSGEAGIGKSRLVRVLREHIASTPHMRWEWRSSPYHQHTALYPISDFFQRTLSWQPEDAPDEKVITLEQALRSYRLPLEETVPLFATLLSLALPAGRYAPLTLSPQRQRQKTLETIVAILLELAERQPVLLVVEDVHWADPTTLALLDLLIEQIPTAPICTVLTCRPTFQPPWSQRSYLTQLTLGRLSRPQVAQMVTSVAGGKPLPAEVMQSLVEKVDGVPLFVEEMTKATLESGHLTESDGHYELVGPLPSLADSDHAPGFLDGPVGPSRHRQSGGPVCRGHWAAVFVRVAPGGDAARCGHAATRVRALSGGGTPLSTRGATPGAVCLQARPHHGHRLSVAIKRYPAAVPPAHR